MLFLFIVFICSTSPHFAQLTSGFDPKEYEQVLGVFAHSEVDSAFFEGIPKPEQVRMIYESPTVGLENKWYLWVNENEKSAILNIRGTTPNPNSWLANFYAAMIPAKGKMKIRNDYTFDYVFSEDPKAAVHVGWTLSAGALSETLLPIIDSLANEGYLDFTISGHSQGGAISYLISANLKQLNRAMRWKEPLRIKTYISAGPKPGNLFFAYDFEFMNAGGWAFNVVNAADWVPEVPFSIQTVNDFSTTNPFSDASGFIKSQKFPKRLVFKKVYNKLAKPSRKALKNYQKFLGKYAGKQVSSSLMEFESPDFFESNYYTRAGNFIVLHPDSEYQEKYPEDPDKLFQHHMLQAYYFLFKKQYPD